MEAIGEGVEDLQLGDAVSTIPGFSLNDYGVYGEVALAPASAVATDPEPPTDPLFLHGRVSKVRTDPSTTPQSEDRYEREHGLQTNRPHG